MIWVKDTSQDINGRLVEVVPAEVWMGYPPGGKHGLGLVLSVTQDRPEGHHRLNQLQLAEQLEQRLGLPLEGLVAILPEGGQHFLRVLDHPLAEVREGMALGDHDHLDTLCRQGIGEFLMVRRDLS